MINETLFLGECPIIRPEGIYYGGRKVIALDPGLQGVGVGAMQRANPLPIGKYWVDVFTPQEGAFRDWLQRNKANVVVTTTETFDPIDSYEGRVWRLFEVRAPVTWEGPGFPTIATPDIKSSDDTVQRPPKEKDPLDQITPPDPNAIAKTIGNAVKAVVIVGVVVVGGVLIVHYLPRPAPLPPSPTPTPSRP
jgi:hypothetical protein